jgi:hypothetical protein
MLLILSRREVNPVKLIRGSWIRGRYIRLEALCGGKKARIIKK